MGQTAQWQIEREEESKVANQAGSTGEGTESGEHIHQGKGIEAALGEGVGLIFSTPAKKAGLH